MWVLLSLSLIRGSQGDLRHAVSLFQAITERKVLEERLEHQEFHAPLTGLANRALFMDHL